MPVQRLRKLVAFERLLARLMTADVPTWALKGGYAMELRMRSARTTKDVDISVELRPASPSPEVQALEISDILQRAAANDLTDFFRFTVGAATQELDGAPYGGVRFPVVSFVGAKVFEQFNIDVAANEGYEEFDHLTPAHRLGFAGIESTSIRTIPVERHFAEKLHAYTLRRQTLNSRTKDLVDMLLFVEDESPDPLKLRAAILKTFQLRGTHDVPQDFPPPPDAWRGPFAQMARECGVSPDLDLAFERVSTFLKPLLV